MIVDQKEKDSQCNTPGDRPRQAETKTKIDHPKHLDDRLRQTIQDT